MAELVGAGALLLAFVNGANDNMKGVATLYGSGELSYRRALALASLATALGGLASLGLSARLAQAFSAKGLLPDALLSDGLLAAVALAAAATVLLATRLGLPVSTTHALLGALLGAGAVAAGPSLELGVLGAGFVLPLLVSPLLAGGVALGMTRGGRGVARRLGLAAETCVCVEAELGAPAEAIAIGDGSAVATPSLPVSLGAHRCEGDRRGAPGVSVRQAVHGAHLVSAGLVSFARGLNDTPKILGLVLGASAMAASTGALAITAAMVLGGLVAARRVTRTIALDVTPMRPETGLAGNLATSALVLGASHLGLPVSTTHVSVGSILGIGAEGASLRARTVRRIGAAWAGTLPLAAVLGAALASWLA
jgi:PiT family inorganic phosphate transporter